MTRAVSPPEAEPEAGMAELHPYWEASAFARTLLAEFEAGRQAGIDTAAREHFYVLARYFRRTLAILHAAVVDRDEPLAVAALRNVLILQRTLGAMHRADPDAAPTTLALEPTVHRRVNRDLVHRILGESRHPLDVAAVTRRFNELDVIADARPPFIARALRSLVATGHAVARDGRYSATGLPYVDANVDRAGLAMLLGQGLAGILAGDGFEGLAEALDRQAEFRARFTAETGFSLEVADLVLACAKAIEAPIEALSPIDRWPHADLSTSSWPRAYQHQVQAIFRSHGYAGQVVEAPNGSGKTMIGMLCIDDWLAELAPGQSILVLVPTVSYQQQWLGELCLKPIGLRLAPHLVYAGTPSGLAALRRRGRPLPAVIVTTYPALARAASGTGKGGFDRGAIERFLQGANVRHVILDEVHKVAADLDSPTAESVRLMLDWLRDGSLSSLIGFSGTLLELQPQLRALGLHLAYVLPPAALIAQGWVAPFTELGVPFNYSEREQRIVALLDRYRTLLVEYLAALGGDWLRSTFTALPMADRARVAAALGMYGDRPDAAERIRERLAGWESGGDLGLAELQVCAILQVARRWPDAALAAEAGADDRLLEWLAAFDDLRTQLRPLLPPGRVRRRLDALGFGTVMETGWLSGSDGPSHARARHAKDALATTFAGLYLGLREWSRQVGEGRVEAVRSIIAVERETRPVSGVIVFDTPAPLERRGGAASPGYRGAGGLYLQLLGDPSSVPIAALATDLYLPDRPEQPLHLQIADWILGHMVRVELGGALLSLLMAGVRLNAGQEARLRAALDEALARFIPALEQPNHARMATFDQQVIRPLRDLARGERRGSGLRGLLTVLGGKRHPHLRGLARTVIDYARLADALRAATRVEALRADGSTCSLRVVPMPGGDRRQRMYDLVGRMVDSPQLPVDVVVVSSWARTGWNVTTPNVLIDATATRDVIAWQQLRGRAMRPWTSWTTDHQRKVQRLMGGDARPRASRERAAAGVMLAHSKVAHIYELVRGYGSAAQVTLDRRSDSWERIDPIAAKHRREWSVRGADGAYLAGPRHAPLMVAADPRRDTPDMLRARLRSELGTGDEPTVRGWLRAGAAAGPSGTGVEASADPGSGDGELVPGPPG